MQIVVCVKLVDGELSPFDASALECALKLRDADRNTEVAVVCMGRTSCREPVSYTHLLPAGPFHRAFLPLVRVGLHDL